MVLQHKATKVTDFLKTFFDKPIIFCGHWPLRSPNIMTPPRLLPVGIRQKLSTYSNTIQPHLPLENINYHRSAAESALESEKVVQNMSRCTGESFWKYVMRFAGVLLVLDKICSFLSLNYFGIVIFFFWDTLYFPSVLWYNFQFW